MTNPSLPLGQTLLQKGSHKKLCFYRTNVSLKNMEDKEAGSQAGSHLGSKSENGHEEEELRNGDG